MKEPQPYFVYMLRCSDNTYYTGITTNVDVRIREHNGLRKGGAKYTHARRPVELAHLEQYDTRSAALKREYALKSLSRQEKELLITSTNDR